MEHYPVVIIGAGVAGLTCAYYLQKRNIPYRVLEASDGVGGRVRTDKMNGFLLDRGFQVFITSYPEARKVLDYELLELKAFRSGAFIRQENRFVQLLNPLKEPLSALPSLFSPVGTLADKLKILQLAGEVKSHEDDALFDSPAASTIDFLKSYGWSDKIIVNFFKPFFGGVFLERDLYTSSNFFRFVFKHFAQGDVVLPSGGIGAIPGQIQSQLPAEAIQLNSKVAGISGKTVYLQSGSSITADTIVLATDKFAANHLLNPAQKNEWPNENAFNQTSCVYFSADRSPLSTNLLVINSSEESLINNMCVPSDIAPSYAPNGKALISVSVVKDHSYAGIELADKIKHELLSWFGDQVMNWQHLKTYHIPYALPAYPASQNHSNHIKAGENLYLCGDYTAYPSLNAAIKSGRIVGEAIGRNS